MNNTLTTSKTELESLYLLRKCFRTETQWSKRNSTLTRENKPNQTWSLLALLSLIAPSSLTQKLSSKSWENLTMKSRWSLEITSWLLLSLVSNWISELVNHSLCPLRASTNVNSYGLTLTRRKSLAHALKLKSQLWPRPTCSVSMESSTTNWLCSKTVVESLDTSMCLLELLPLKKELSWVC